MSIASETEYELTRQKLVAARDMLSRRDAQPGENSVARALSRRSLRAYVNQLVEELTRYEVEHGIEPGLLHAAEPP